MMRSTIDLNVDIGEGFAYDSELLEYATSVNVACGWHAGDPLTMRNTTSKAIQRGVAIGAHPSFPDRENFGRLPMHLPLEEVYADVQYQVGALAAVVAGLNGRVTHVKPHGALYNQAEEDADLARTIVRAVRDFDPQLAIFGLAGGQLVGIARDEGMTAIDEGFADRAYTAGGQLVPRSQPGAVLESDALACQQALSMVREGCTQASDGTWIEVRPQTLCLHGDGEHAVTFAQRLKEVFSAAGVRIRPALGELAPR